MNLDSNIIEFPLFSSTLDENGNWIHKSKDLQFKKKDGTLKAQYKDLPRVKAIYEIEASVKNDFKKTLENTVKDINDKLIEFSK